MDSAILSATAALAGSLIGGASTLAASWLNQSGQLRANALIQEAAKRETLYAEFIIEASKRLAEAWGRQAESPEVIAILYSAVERMRLTSSREVIHCAEQVVRFVVETYAAPNKSFDEARARVEHEGPPDPLGTFTEACRTELCTLRGRSEQVLSPAPLGLITSRPAASQTPKSAMDDPALPAAAAE